MNTLNIKESASISIDADILSQIKEEAKARNKSLSTHIEALLYEMGYRPYNEETIKACQEAREGKTAGVVDTSSLQAIEQSLWGDEEA